MFLEKEFASGVESATFASAKTSKKNWTNQEVFLRVQGSGAFRGKNLAETRSFWLMGSEWKIAGFLPKHFKRSCQHRIPYVQRKALRQKCFFFKKKVSLTFFSDLEWRKYGFVAEVFHRSVKNKIHVTRRIFGKTLFGRTYNFISFDGFCEENLICKKTQGSSVRHSTGPVEQSKGQNSGETKPF